MVIPKLGGQKDGKSGILKGKVALVTGGSRGIGAAIVRRFAREGARVYFTYRASKKEAEELAGSFGKPESVFCFACDVRKKTEIEATVERIFEKEERIDILVNNAGIIRDGLFLALPDEDWEEVMRTNLGGTWLFSKSVAGQMVVRRQGRILNISSIAGELGSFGQANYAASKGAVNSLTKTLAAELASKNITVNAIAPGLVDTEMSAPVRALLGQEIQKKIPLGSFAQPEEIAALAAFLASEEARYITGQVIAIDGGLSLLSRR